MSPHDAPSHPAVPVATRTPWRLLPVVALSLLLLTGCAFQEQRTSLRALGANGQWGQALRMLEEPKVEKLYEPNNELLLWLDRGSAALAVGDPRLAINQWEKAEAFMEAHTEPNAGDFIGQWVINDTVTEYIGDPYEAIYVNVFKLAAQLELGVINGGASVEARRAASKANRLRDRYLVFRKAVVSEGGASAVSERESSGAPVGEFVESTLGAYLTAVTFMADGDPANQEVAARRLQESITVQGPVYGPVNAADFDGLGYRRPTPRDMLVVAFSGQGPTKRAESFGPIPIYTWPVYFEIPVVVPGSSEVASARVVIEPSDQAEGEPGPQARSAPLALVEDMGLVAVENDRRQQPIIYARAFIRSTAKAAAAFAASQAVTQNGQKGGWTTAAAILGGLAFVTVTERADLRCWELLPGKAHVGLLAMHEGVQRVRIEYLAASGGLLYASPWRIIGPGSYAPGENGAGLHTVIEQYWR
ncbi:MAG: hypothetical protein KF745_15325 [Phycisphaeraceae bacterium]|nr:hypothetical protein [Phycisphaeraceae bacterium]